LFKPLGIEKYTWAKTRSGYPSAASGLRMRSRDMAKFGLLFLNSGKWNQKQIIPSHLVAQSLTSQAITHYADSIVPFVGYSNQFWIYTEKIKGEMVKYVQAQGNGGQIIQLDRKNNLVLVVTAGNYNRRDLRKNSFDIYPNFVYPAIKHSATSSIKPDFIFPAATKAAKSDQPAEIIKSLTHKAFEAVFKQDTATISGLMYEPFISIYPAKINNKQEELAGIHHYIETTKKQGQVFDSFYFDEFDVVFYDNTAVAVYFSVSTGKNKGVPFKSRMRWYDVWVNRNGTWKMASSQGTSVNQ
jgi:hypothetical protein